MLQALGHQQAAQEKEGGHGYIGATDEAAGELLKGVFVAIAKTMGKDDHDGSGQPDQLEIIPFSFVQVAAQMPARGEPFTAEHDVDVKSGV